MKKIITILTFIPCLCFGQWNQLGADINGNMANDEFGYSVALNDNGDTFVTGAKSVNSSTGQVKVFQWNGSLWTQKGSIINGVISGDQLGTSVDISDEGNTILMGATELGISGAPGYSAVYEWNGSNWMQKGSDIIGENTPINGAGGNVSISSDGNIIAIGADGNSNSNGSYTGHARVYQWNSTDWIQLGVDIDGFNQFDGFGAAVSLNSNGNLLAVGATGAGIGGEVYVFEWNGTNWVQIGTTLAGGINNSFGTSIDLNGSGTTLSIGATSNDNDFGSGYVEVFSWDGANWNLKGSRLQTNPNGDDFFFNNRLSQDGNIIVIGGYGANEGFVEIHNFNGTNWTLEDIRINGENNGDFFGFAVDISNDGSRIVAGAPENGSNGSQSGEVKVFENLSVLGIQNVNLFNEVKLFPNPTQNIVQIMSSIEIESYALMTINGKTIISEIINGTDNLKINLTGLNSGLYILNIQASNKSKNIKLIKE